MASQETELLFGLARVGFATLEQSLGYREGWERGRRSFRGKKKEKLSLSSPGGAAFHLHPWNPYGWSCLYQVTSDPAAEASDGPCRAIAQEAKKSWVRGYPQRICKWGE